MNILLTGVSTGIGRALAERLLSKGHAVWGISRQSSQVPALQKHGGAHFHHSAGDITDPSAVKAIVDSMRDKGFVPDVVVLNAGIYPHDCDEAFRFEVAQRVLSTNINGALVFVDLFLPQFLARGSGQFLAVSSLLALRPDPLGASYAASKAGLTMAFRSLALRYRGTGVQFKAMLFGPIGTGDREKPAVSSHIPSAEQAAAALERALYRSRTLSYYPWLVGMIFRTTAWLPDRVFHALTRPFRR